MDESTAEAWVRGGATSRPLSGPVWWVLGSGVLTTAGLGIFTLALLVTDALAYGMATVLSPEAEVAAPDTGRYGFAFAVGAMAHLVTAAALTRLASRAAIRTWPLVVQGLGIALVAAAV
jgi:hypothetical protein